MVVAKVAVVAREAADVARVAAKVTRVRPIIETTPHSLNRGSEGSGLSWDRSRGYARNAWTAVAA
jgi:hypothetical protein